MADALDQAAQRVRSRTGIEIHDLAAAVTDPIVGRRRYKTDCHRYFYNDEGAVLTTRPATCVECAKARAMTRAEARAVAQLVGATA